jgi:hypothetical protein
MKPNFCILDHGLCLTRISKVAGRLSFLLCLMASGLLLAQEPDFPPPLPLETDTSMISEPVDTNMVEGIEPENNPALAWAGEAPGVGGVYEVVLGVEDHEYALRYFKEFGYRLIGTGYMTRLAAETLYGVPSAFKSYRLQNGNTDSHGLIRLIEWEEPVGKGIGYAVPGTIGTRMMGMLTKDIYYLEDIYANARKGGEPWLFNTPVMQYPMGAPMQGDFFERPVISREMAVYGQFCNHLFFQRNNYTVPGYGYIHPGSKLGCSEVISHDFFVTVDSMEQLNYLQTVFGWEADGAPAINGEWMSGPRELYFLQKGETFWFQSWKSPNNIAGRVRFFIPTTPKADQSNQQGPGFQGISMHTVYTPFVENVWQAALDAMLSPSPILPNEFGEKCFVLKGPEGAHWQIIERLNPPVNEPIPHLHLQILD